MRYNKNLANLSGGGVKYSPYGSSMHKKKKSTLKLKYSGCYVLNVGYIMARVGHGKLIKAMASLSSVMAFMWLIK